MSASDHNDWNVIDNFPEKDIKDIEPISERLSSAYVRVPDREKLTVSPLNIQNVVLRVEALEYHYSRFKETTKDLVPNPKLPKSRDSQEQAKLKIARCEAMAYLNTVGWLYHWARSEKANPAKITELAKSFRAKSTAHLSMHDPRKETPHELEVQALVFLGFLWADGDLLFQTQVEEGQSIQFNLLKDHKQILEEIENLFEAMLKNQNEEI